MGKKTGTKEKILEVSSKLFAHNGYQGTTISDICSGADVNIASVNYHFGSKDNLYKESWVYSFEKLEQKYNVNIDSVENAEEALHLLLHKFIYKMIDKEAYAFDILEKDHLHENGQLHEMAFSKIMPSKKLMRDFFVKLNSKIDEERVDFLFFALYSQTAQLRKMANNNKVNIDIEKTVDSISDFIILGIKHYKENK